MKKVWITVQEWSGLSVPQKIAKAREIKSKMTGNVFFPAPDPSLTDLGNKATLLEDAQTDADTGNHAAVAHMHTVEFDLGIMVRNEANYVEKVANADFENGEEIIKSGGYRPRKVTVRAPRVFKAVSKKVPGEVKLSIAKQKRASYVWQHSANGTDGWITAGTTTDKASFTFGGLTSGARVYFRMAVIIGGAQGEWSNIISIIIL